MKSLLCLLLLSASLFAQQLPMVQASFQLGVPNGPAQLTIFANPFDGVIPQSGLDIAILGADPSTSGYMIISFNGTYAFNGAPLWLQGINNQIITPPDVIIPIQYSSVGQTASSGYLPIWLYGSTATMTFQAIGLDYFGFITKVSNQVVLVF